ncbi:hypothetical protein GQF61_13410 [Sphingobacterium sp. DK4209]|uniref:3-oxoacyl-ACP synthase n=1 Tax=Sphingobacterium zhuxiongii TaxID=2662364 RepID=A0A5Q0Q9K8_9SPHI|nr:MULTISPECIES: hypothetical protein [unclassified Sphingobacterium]MVZ66854.1 hypothetical protein [Sphingobacterium sp. DK4209]QGA26223.1 hypothetical protein GFH32_07745 [Sphingobacterium sp. dk4302]
MIEKKLLIDLCVEKTKNRVNEIQVAIDAANDAIVNDTKSSMGDKYETSREMAQQELSRLQNQLNQANKDLDILLNLPEGKNKLVGMGSLVMTDQFNYLVATSIGPMKIENEILMVVSRLSPIGEVLFGKEVDDEIHFNGKRFKIKAIK